MDLDDIRLFAAVAREGSYARAAERLGVARSTLSRVVQRLEAETGTTLLHRTTRRVGLTTTGAALLERVSPSLADLESALEELRQRLPTPGGRLRITTTTDTAVSLVAPAMARLTARHPTLELESVLTLRTADLVAEQIDAAVRVYGGVPNDSTLKGRYLMPLDFGWYASPDYLARRGCPQSEVDLARHDRIGVGVNQDGRARFQVDDPPFARALVREGAAIGLLPIQFCRDDEAAGRIVRLLDDTAVLQTQVWLVYPVLTANVAAFRDALTEYIAERVL